MNITVASTGKYATVTIGKESCGFVRNSGSGKWKPVDGYTLPVQTVRRMRTALRDHTDGTVAPGVRVRSGRQGSGRAFPQSIPVAIPIQSRGGNSE